MSYGLSRGNIKAIMRAFNFLFTQVRESRPLRRVSLTYFVEQGNRGVSLQTPEYAAVQPPVEFCGEGELQLGGLASRTGLNQGAAILWD